MSVARLLAVCPVLPFPPVDGGRKRTLRLLEAAAADGLVPHVITTFVEGGPEHVAALRDRGWTVEVLPPAPTSIAARARQHARRRPTPLNPAISARLHELASAPGTLVQIEHTQSAYYGRALRGRPWILSLHNVDSELQRRIAMTERPGTLAWLRAWNQWQATRTVERREVGRAPAVLCVSERDRDILAAASGARIVVAPNGVDDDLFATPPAGPGATALFFGRLDYPPNHHGLSRFLREGWPEVVAALPAARFRIVGSGASPELESLARATPGTEFVGYVEDLGAELRAAQMTVVPLWAGSGTRLKVLESLAAARPVAGTALGVEGLGFRSGQQGLVAETPAELAAAMARLLGDPKTARTMGVAARGLAEGYRWSRTTEPAVALYRWLIAAPTFGRASSAAAPAG